MPKKVPAVALSIAAVVTWNWLMKAATNSWAFVLTDLSIPQGANITNAYIQFQVDEPFSGTTDLMIEGHATNNAPTFTSANANISNRNRTNAVVGWTPVPWTTVGEAGTDQQTPDIATVIQEIVNRPQWLSGNSLAVILSGSGRRTAESFNGDPNGAALLHIDYTPGTGANQAPVVDAGTNQTVILPNGSVDVSLNATVNDDGQPAPPAQVDTLWTQEDGPGTVTFTDDAAVDTTANFDTAGSYTLRLAADDGDLTSFDELTVTVNAAGTATTLAIRISASSDDAEENTATGIVDRGSSDLELVEQGSHAANRRHAF